MQAAIGVPFVGTTVARRRLQPIFDANLPAHERESALAAAVEYYRGDAARGGAPTTGDFASAGVIPGKLIKLGMLLMMQRKYTAAMGVLKKARAADPWNFLTHQLIGYCLEATLTPEWGSEVQLMAAFNTSWAIDAPWHLQDWFWLMPRGYDGFKPHRVDYTKASMNALVPLLVHHEFRSELGHYADPYLSVLSRSRAPGGGAGSTGVMDSKHANPRALVSRFAKQDVLVLRNLLSPWEMQTVRAHYKEVMHMIPPGGDRFVTSCTSDRLGYWLNMRLKPVIETIAGQRMHPSYSYLVKYYGFEGNPGLKPHTDQVDNEYTVTIAVDWEPSEFGPVPIYFGHNRLKQREQGAWQSEPKPHERTKVDLHYGDAMLFRGRRHAHFRNAYPLGKNSTNLLIHFVKDSYPVHQNRWLHNQAHKNE